MSPRFRPRLYFNALYNFRVLAETQFQLLDGQKCVRSPAVDQKLKEAEIKAWSRLHEHWGSRLHEIILSKVIQKKLSIASSKTTIRIYVTLERDKWLRSGPPKGRSIAVGRVQWNGGRFDKNERYTCVDICLHPFFIWHLYGNGLLLLHTLLLRNG
ncbi:hypothetical protein LguiA_002070 [Lonicera macranthoides]